MRVPASENWFIVRDIITVKSQTLKDFKLFGGKAVVKTQSSNTVIINENIEHLRRSTLHAETVQSLVLKWFLQFKRVKAPSDIAFQKCTEYYPYHRKALLPLMLLNTLEMKASSLGQNLHENRDIWGLILPMKLICDLDFFLSLYANSVKFSTFFKSPKTPVPTSCQRPTSPGFTG